MNVSIVVKPRNLVPMKLKDFTVVECNVVVLFSRCQLCLQSQFKEKMNMLFSHITGDPKAEVTDDDIRSLMFGDYMSKGKGEKLYDEIEKLDELREVSMA